MQLCLHLFDKSGRTLSDEILGHVRWVKIGLWNDDGTYYAAALLHILRLHGFYSGAGSNTGHSDDVYFDKSGEKLRGEILGHAKWPKIGLLNDDATYSAAAPLQWPKVSIFGIFRTYMDTIKKQILMQWIWYFLTKFIW